MSATDNAAAVSGPDDTTDTGKTDSGVAEWCLCCLTPLTDGRTTWLCNVCFVGLIKSGTTMVCTVHDHEVDPVEAGSP